MQSKDIVKKYQFSKDEHDKLQNLHIGMVVAKAQLDGMQIYKNVILGQVYERLGIDTKPNKEFNQSIDYDLSLNTITHTKTPKEEKK